MKLPQWFYGNAKFRVGLQVDNLTNEKCRSGYSTMNLQKFRSVTPSRAFKF